MNKKIAAFFDVDGTIYRDSLLIEHFKKLIKYEIMPKDAYSSDIKKAFQLWENRQGDYEVYLGEICNLYRDYLVGVKESDILFAVEKVMQLESDRLYTYTRDRIKWHLSKGHVVIFISGSPDYLVSEMAKKFNIHDYAGSIYVMANNAFTGEIKPMWDHENKNAMMDKMTEKYDIDLSKSYAYGDTNGDITMLRKVGNPIAVNPSRELMLKMKKDKSISENLKIVVERKDVVYVLDKNIAYIR